MSRVTSTILTILAVSSLVLARNAADLSRDLKALAPANTKVRLAWIKGGHFAEFPFYASTTVVYVVDSDDGVIRRLYPATGSGTYYQVNVTADGSKVLFYDKNTDRLCIVNWDGSNFRAVSVGGEVLEYWRNSTDNTDWAIVYVNDVSRVRIDQPSTRVRIGAGGYAGNGGSGLSDDGTKLVGYCYQGCSVPFGIVNTATNQWTSGIHGGCWCTMSAGSAPKYSHNPSGHGSMCVHDAANQSSFTVYETAKTITDSLTKRGLMLPAGPTNGCGEWETTEGTRFTQHPNFATTMYSRSSVNPMLMRLPDLKFVWIEDGLSCGFCGDMDAVFLNTSVISRNPVPVRPTTGTLRAGAEAYLPDGRRMLPASKPVGVVVQRMRGRWTAVPAAAALP